jgi:hypothetical protein
MKLVANSIEMRRGIHYYVSRSGRRIAIAPQSITTQDGTVLPIHRALSQEQRTLEVLANFRGRLP